MSNAIPQPVRTSREWTAEQRAEALRLIAELPLIPIDRR